MKSIRKWGMYLFPKDLSLPSLFLIISLLKHHNESPSKRSTMIVKSKEKIEKDHGNNFYPFYPFYLKEVIALLFLIVCAINREGVNTDLSLFVSFNLISSWSEALGFGKPKKEKPQSQQGADHRHILFW